MENNTNRNGKNGFFSILYRTRLMMTKGETTILNLSLLFSIIALLSAPWLVIGGAIVALVLGYKFAIDRNAEGFDKDFEHVVKDAASNVRHAVEDISGGNHTDTGSGDAQA
ncbi:MAG: DUF4342 domain-containing protein [Clostridiales bacterium]|nr:DUF4342 domain-containing protein [Clostridiales bacterium]